MINNWLEKSYISLNNPSRLSNSKDMVKANKLVKIALKLTNMWM